MAPTPVAPPYVVDGAERTPLPYGLFSVLPGFRGNEDRWMSGGVTWEPESSDMLGIVGPLRWEERDQDGTSGLPKNLEYTVPDPGVADSFAVYGKFVASPQAWDQARAYARARSDLLNHEERTVEYTVWNGARGVTPNFVSTPLIGTYGTPSAAIDGIEKWIGDTYGSVGVIHMSRSYASSLLASRDLISDSGRLYTRLGTPVVAGAGYDEGKIVATPAMFGYRSEIFIPSAVPGDILDITEDNQYALAERQYLIGFDPVGVGHAVISE